jgi:hypothetical protein
MSKSVRCDVRSVDALHAFQALTRHSSPDEGIFAEKPRNHRAFTEIRKRGGGAENG